MKKLSGRGVRGILAVNENLNFREWNGTTLQFNFTISRDYYHENASQNDGQITRHIFGTETVTYKSSHLWMESTIPHKNIETNDKFYRKVAFLMYTEMVNFRPQI